jgi:uncharacterized protein
MMNSSPVTLEQRIAAAERPGGWNIMHQNWDKLLFLHWKMPVDVLRPLIPEPLSLDLYEGEAYVSITPLTIWDLRPVMVPAIPYLSELHELNVRTYVHYDGVPGVWFFSLDANNALAVIGARTFFSLPYVDAEINMSVNDRKVEFESRRSDGLARFNANWTIGARLPLLQPGSLDYFLLERYSLYSADERSIYRCRISHEPWPVYEITSFGSFDSNMLSADGLPEPTDEPLLHSGGPVHVDVWPLERVAERIK